MRLTIDGSPRDVPVALTVPELVASGVAVGIVHIVGGE
jgi:hypothetical protein